MVLTHQSLFCIPSWSSKAAVDLCPIYFPECFKWTLSFDHWRHLLIWFYCTMTDNIHIYTHICSRYTKYKCVRGRSSVHRLSKIGSISDLVYAGVKFKCRVVHQHRRAGTTANITYTILSNPPQHTPDHGLRQWAITWTLILCVNIPVRLFGWPLRRSFDLWSKSPDKSENLLTVEGYKNDRLK